MSWQNIAEKELENYIKKLETIQLNAGLGYSICGTEIGENEVDDDFIAELESGVPVHVNIAITKEDVKKLEEEEMEKGYTTLRENFGSMPLPGYISEINQKICTKDGWDVIAFLKELETVTHQLTGASEHRDWAEQEAFIILSYDDSSMELQWEILFDLANSEKKFDYDTHYYRIYTRDEDWGLDEIEPLKEKEEYELVKVKVYRDCVVRECAELYISVKKGFGEDAKEEAEHYVGNSYCGNIKWERESEYNYEEEGNIQIDESWIEDTDTKEELESSYDIDETLEY